MTKIENFQREWKKNNFSINFLLRYNFNFILKLHFIQRDMIFPIKQEELEYFFLCNI